MNFRGIVKSILSIFKDTPQVVPEKKPLDSIYYTVEGVQFSKYSLKQYVKFYEITKDGVRNITRKMAYEYFLVPYTGRSDKYKGTAILQDYDIVRLQKKLGSVQLLETIM